MVIMLLKVGIDKKGINGDVDSYIFNQKFSFYDIEKMKKIASNFVENIPIEYDQIEIYSYDTNAIAKIEFIEVVKTFITSERKIKVYHMVYDQTLEEYIRHRIK